MCFLTMLSNGSEKSIGSNWTNLSLITFKCSSFDADMMDTYERTIKCYYKKVFLFPLMNGAHYINMNVTTIIIWAMHTVLPAKAKEPKKYERIDDLSNSLPQFQCEYFILNYLSNCSCNFRFFLAKLKQETMNKLKVWFQPVRLNVREDEDRKKGVWHSS